MTSPRRPADGACRVEMGRITATLVAALAAGCSGAPRSDTPASAPAAAATAAAESCAPARAGDVVVAIGPGACLLARDQWSAGLAKVEARGEDLVATAVPVSELCPAFELVVGHGAAARRTPVTVDGGPLIDPALCCHLERLALVDRRDLPLVRALGTEDARECLGGTAHPLMSAVYRVDTARSSLDLVSDDSRADVPGPR
jgi:hypothetical protein